MNINDIDRLLIIRKMVIEFQASDFDLICSNETEYQVFLEYLQQLLTIEPGVVYLNDIYKKLFIILSNQRNKHKNSKTIETANDIIRQINSLINYSKDTLNEQKNIYVQNQCALRFGNPIVIDYLRNFNSCEGNALLSMTLLTLLEFDRQFLLDLKQCRATINSDNILYYISSLSYFTSTFKDSLTDEKSTTFINTLKETLQKIILELKKSKGIDKITYKSCIDVFENMNNEKNNNSKSKIKKLK